jgi:5-hydroxyisourate hydrolase
MAKLSTHILDTAHGIPAKDVVVELYSLDGAAPHFAPRLILSSRTNADGRTDKPLLEGDAVKSGRYRIVFYIGDHFRNKGLKLADPPFIDIVPVDFGIEDGGSYHVPLVCSPWTYSTYRGS